VGAAWLRRGLIAARQGARDRAVQSLERALSLGASPLPALEGDEMLREAERRVGGTTLAIVGLPSTPPPGTPLRIPLRVSGDRGGLVERVAVSWRRDGSAWSETSGARDASEIALAVTLPPGGRVEYYLRALGSADATLAQAGSPDAPLSLTAGPAPPPPIVERARPWHRRWWVWTLAGGVIVAGVAIGLGVGLTSSSGPPTVHVPLH